MVTEQIANLSAGNRRPGSNPGLSAQSESLGMQNAQSQRSGHFFCVKLTPQIGASVHDLITSVNGELSNRAGPLSSVHPRTTMSTSHQRMYPELLERIHALRVATLHATRLEVLQPLIAYVQAKVDANTRARLNFICTHNSRRSQFSQIWAQTAADYFGVPVVCLSGGVEVTAFNERAVASTERSGFEVEHGSGPNPVCVVRHSPDGEAVRAFSKVFDDLANAGGPFAAVMTCAHADEHCPFIPDAEARVTVRYEDPKAFDDTLEEAVRYDERSDQIASEMLYVFSQINLPS